MGFYNSMHGNTMTETCTTHTPTVTACNRHRRHIKYNMYSNMSRATGFEKLLSDKTLMNDF